MLAVESTSLPRAEIELHHTMGRLTISGLGCQNSMSKSHSLLSSPHQSANITKSNHPPDQTFHGEFIPRQGEKYPQQQRHPRKTTNLAEPRIN
jgi:hypothetical protein